MKVPCHRRRGVHRLHVAQLLLARGDEVVGLDNLNDYYDPNLKQARLARSLPLPGFRFVKQELADRDGMAALFAREKFQRVVHLAAQAGVRYSLENPHAYVDSNVTGTLNVLEGCRHNGVEHLVFASTSSVYGLNTNMPFSVHKGVDHPLSLYASTKKANELMAHNYAALFKLPCTGLRFFTVYGPWGRPDMALFLFTRNILEGKPIDVFNYGHHKRDFTFVEDIAEGVVRALDRPPRRTPTGTAINPDPATSSAPYRLYNIGNNSPVELRATSKCSRTASAARPSGTCCRCSRVTCRTPSRTWKTWCATWAIGRQHAGGSRASPLRRVVSRVLPCCRRWPCGCAVQGAGRPSSPGE
jgi:UDP-glucuronate 4-epimerase